MSQLTDSISARSAGRPGFLARLAFALAAGMLIGAAVAALSPGLFWPGWLAASLLSTAGLLCLVSAWHWAGGGRLLGWMIALAFLLRLATGVGLSLALPHWGYPEPEQQAGYLFKDANNRDLQAWDLARSNHPLWASFRDDFTTDQYGGLLGLSALVYRYLSPDAHRPFLILILAASVTALGVPFLRQAARLRWPERVATIATWIYIFYPDAIFFGSGQMREPFLVGLGAVAFWAVLAWDWRKKSSWLALAGSLLAMAMLSSRVAVAVAGFLALLFILEHIISLPDRRWKILGWLALCAGLALVLLFSWDWFRSSAKYDALVTQRTSGQVSVRIKEIGEQYALLFTVAYGVARPVLPAAITETDVIPLWKVIGIVRSLGWYALAPFLLYGLFTTWRYPDKRQRRLLLWLVMVVFLWLVIASARGGADGIDNPRYRSLFIPWMALLAAWSVDWALTRRDAWLWRWIAVEIIFLAFFTHWYIARYYRWWLRIQFWEMVFWIILLSSIVLAGGWLWDRRRAKQDTLTKT